MNKNDELYIEKSETIHGGLDPWNDNRVPTVSILRGGGNYTSSRVCIKFSDPDSILLEDEYDNEVLNEADVVYVELEKKTVEDLIKKLTFALKNLK